MAKLIIFSWNVRGLNTALKISNCLDVIGRKGADIAMLQETHVLEQDIHRIENTNYSVASYSSANNKSKGVIIIIRKGLKFNILEKGGDQEGRITYVKGTFGGQKIALVNVYAPNSYEQIFYESLSNYIADLIGYQIIVGADFNAVFNHRWDRSNNTINNSLSNTALCNLAQHFNLTDVWRFKNPDKKEYTFFSARHQTFSRIDVILLSSGLLHYVKSVAIIHMSLSDHHANRCEFLFPSNSPKRAPRWRLNLTLLQNPQFCQQFKQGLAEFVSVNKDSVADIRYVWNAIKGYIRNSSIAFSSGVNRRQLKAILDLERIQSKLIEEQQSNFNRDKERQLAKTTSELNALITKRSEFLVHRAKQSDYLDGSKPSYLLASKIRYNEGLADIPSIINEAGTLVHDPSLINLEFQKFYKTLYTSDITNTEELEHFFIGLDLPHLSLIEAETLEAPITLNEIYDALKSMNAGKSPGLDGIPPEMYQTFWPEIGPIILEMFQKAISEGNFHRDVNTAIISLLHKKGKDPNLCSSYRAISLLNADVKLYAKVITKRLETVLLTLVHSNQSGFVKNRFASDNIRRLLHIIHLSSNMISPCAILSIDCEKAFDRLQWPYLWFTLKKFGFGEGFIGMLKTLYNNPTAVVLTGNQSSSPFNITRGCRQGCPLSGLLFIISLEVLAQKIRQSENVKPILVQNTSHKISLYADDLLLYMNDVPTTLPAVLEIFRKFSLISGYKINSNKSALLPLNKIMMDTQIVTTIPIVPHFRYLGIDIYANIETIIAKNYNRLYNAVKEDHDKWDKLNLSIASRISIVRMNTLPKVNFYVSMLPLATPHKFWDKVKTCVSKFIWNKKKPRIRTSILEHSKESGGQNLPNFELYYISFILRPLQQWFDEASQAPWVQIEQNIVSPFPLKDILFSNLTDEYCMERFGPIIAHAVRIWKQTENIFQWEIPWHKNTPIFRNNRLLIGQRPITFSQWQRCGINTLPDMMSNDGLMTFQELKSKFNLPGTSFFFYLQLRTAMRTYGVPWNDNLPKHPVAEMVTSNITKGFVSHVYGELQKATNTFMGITTIWNVELRDHGQVDWRRVWNNIAITSRNYNHQMIHYKLIHRFYLTPRKCCQLQMVPTPLCTLCPSRVVGTYMHMFWECDRVKTFWSRVTHILSDLFEVEVPCSPQILLLNDDSTLSIPVNQKRVFFAGITAAKKILVSRWKPPHSLSIRKWKISFLNVLSLEISIARTNGAKMQSIDALLNAAEKIKAQL